MWEVLEKVVRFKGSLAHADVIIQRRDMESPFIYAVVDEKRDKAMVLHAKCDTLEEAKTMALGSLQAYEAIVNNRTANTLFAIEDEVIMVGIRTEYGDKYEPIALSGYLNTQIQEIISQAASLYTKDNSNGTA